MKSLLFVSLFAILTAGQSNPVAQVARANQPKLLPDAQKPRAAMAAQHGPDLQTRPVSFGSAVIYNSGGYSAANVDVADVNGDGHPDLVVANYCQNIECVNGGVGVLLGNADGTFQTPVSYSSGGSGANSVAIGDVNGDGHPDLLVANSSTGSVGVLLGNGDGTFQTAVTYDSLAPYSVAIGDVNGDGKPDLVVANGGFNSVSVLLGKGDGTFQPAVTYYEGGDGALSVAIGDVNGDGKLDLVVANNCAFGKHGDDCTHGSVSVLLGKGDGTFQAPVIFNSGGVQAESVAIMDVNSDGRPDLLVTNRCANLLYCPNGSVGVLLNQTSKATTTTALTSSPNPSQVDQSVTFTATVTSTNGAIPDGEIVTFFDGTAPLSSVPLAGGVATYATSALSGKTHTIKATYSGDAFHKASSGTVTQVVNKYPTTTTLSSSLNPSQFGQAVTFTAHVTSTGPAPTGSVKFLDGTTSIGLATLSAGVAKLTKSNLAVGTHPITAHYNGDAASSTSTSSVVNQVVQ